MSRRTDIVTPDSVQLSYELAGLGSRFVGLFVDTLLQGTLTAAAYMVLGLSGLAGSFQWKFTGFTWLVALGLLGLFAVWWLYFPFFETVWHGQTPGKRYAGIRVLRDGGFPLDFRGALIRNVVRIADWLPGVYALGGACVLLHPQCKRLGDLAAGTMVIRERQEEESVKAKTRAHLPGARLSRPVHLNPSVPLDLSMAPVQALTREQLQGVKRYLDRRGDLDLATQETLAEKISQPLLNALSLTPESIGHRYNDFLTQVVEAFEQRHAARLDL